MHQCDINVLQTSHFFLPTACEALFQHRKKRPLPDSTTQEVTSDISKSKSVKSQGGKGQDNQIKTKAADKNVKQKVPLFFVTSKEKKCLEKERESNDLNGKRDDKSSSKRENTGAHETLNGDNAEKDRREKRVVKLEDGRMILSQESDLSDSQSKIDFLSSLELSYEKNKDISPKCVSDVSSPRTKRKRKSASDDSVYNTGKKTKQADDVIQDPIRETSDNAETQPPESNDAVVVSSSQECTPLSEQHPDVDIMFQGSPDSLDDMLKNYVAKMEENKPQESNKEATRKKSSSGGSSKTEENESIRRRNLKRGVTVIGAHSKKTSGTCVMEYGKACLVFEEKRLAAPIIGSQHKHCYQLHVKVWIII